MVTHPRPDGDAVTKTALPSNVDPVALQAASDWAFNRESPEQITLSLLVVQGNQIIHERYAPGVDMTTRTRTWSTAKSLVATLFGGTIRRTGRTTRSSTTPGRRGSGNP